MISATHVVAASRFTSVFMFQYSPLGHPGGDDGVHGLVHRVVEETHGLEVLTPGWLMAASPASLDRHDEVVLALQPGPGGREHLDGVAGAPRTSAPAVGLVRLLRLVIGLADLGHPDVTDGRGGVQVRRQVEPIGPSGISPNFDWSSSASGPPGNVSGSSTSGVGMSPTSITAGPPAAGWGLRWVVRPVTRRDDVEVRMPGARDARDRFVRRAEGVPSRVGR